VKIWITTDTHFSHEKLIEFGRPEDFECRIKNGLRRNVKPEDLLIHLGDICVGDDEENSRWFKEELGCRTILVKGNHDRKTNNWYMHNGWDMVVDRMQFELYGKKIAFTHIPLKWDGSFDINIHGHMHDFTGHHPNIVTRAFNKLVSLEWRDYQPTLLKTLIEEANDANSNKKETRSKEDCKA
jgi:calcineurin-like phosphoesterase family protein